MVLDLTEECQAALAAIESFKRDMRDLCQSMRAVQEKVTKLRFTQGLMIIGLLSMMVMAVIVGTIPYVGWVAMAVVIAITLAFAVAIFVLDRIIAGLNSTISDMKITMDEMQKTLSELIDRALEVCPESCIPNESRQPFICRDFYLYDDL